MLFSRRRSPLAIAGLVVYAGVLVAGVTWFITDQISRSEIAQARRAADAAAAAQLRYTGTVTIPGEVPGQCRHLEFDNITGALREGYRTPCAEEGNPAGNSTLGRLGAIRDAFSRR
jgi:hypothetical protein